MNSYEFSPKHDLLLPTRIYVARRIYIYIIQRNIDDSRAKAEEVEKKMNDKHLRGTPFKVKELKYAEAVRRKNETWCLHTTHSLHMLTNKNNNNNNDANNETKRF